MKKILQCLGLADASGDIEVKKDIDLNQLVMTPEEGFLLSRIDAANSLQEVFQISPFPPEQTEKILLRFVEADIIRSKAKSSPGTAAENPRGARTSTRTSGKTVRTPRDTVEWLDDRLCFQIEDKYDELLDGTLSPHKILGTSQRAKPADIKKAYLRLSKKYHPDRFFRQDAGKYRQWVEFIFGRVNEAFQELKASSRKNQRDGREKYGNQKLKEAEKALSEKVLHARSLVKQAKAQAPRDPVAGVSTLRLALTFDPKNEEAQALLDEHLPRMQFRKAATYFQEAKELEEMSAFERAAESYRKAANGDPKNVEFQRVCGEFLLFKVKEVAEALDFAKRAVDLEGNNVNNWLLMGHAAKAAKNFPGAATAFEKVLQLDNSNLFAKNELADLKKTLNISNRKRSS